MATEAPPAPRRPLAALAVALCGVLAALLLACGGDDSSGDAVIDGDSDPQEILDNALGGGKPIESGVLDASLELGSGDEAGAKLSLQGPFQSGGDGELPQLDFTASASGSLAGAPLVFDGGLTVTSDGAYVSYGGQDYAVPEQQFQAFKALYASSAKQSDQGSQGSLQQLGIDPSTWVTDVTNEGTEDLDGTEVVHVSGSADVSKIVDDLSSVAAQSGQASQIDAAALNQLASTIREATIDVYASSADETLRQLDVDLVLAGPTGGSQTSTIALSVGISEPNSQQEITAPADAQPLSELQGALPGNLEGLGGLGGGGGAGDTDATDAYFNCVSKAQTQAAFDKCSALLGG